ncbi:hypothetical protein [Nostoc sp.]
MSAEWGISLLYSKLAKEELGTILPNAQCPMPNAQCPMPLNS